VTSLAVAADDVGFEAAVQADWEAQEVRFGRTSSSVEAIRAVLDRATRLLDDMHAMQPGAERKGDGQLLQQLAQRAARAHDLIDSQRRALYFQIRTVSRRIALDNPLVKDRPILFLQRHRAIGYMLYEYLGWYYAYGYDPTNGAKSPQFATPPTGGGVFVLDQPGRSFEARELTAGLLPPGHFVTLALSHDARTAYFAFADPSGKDPYDSPGFVQGTAEPGVKYNTFHLYALQMDGSQLKQISDGPYDDFDPCPLPDGGLAFESTRRGSKLRCGGGSPELVYTLHKLDGVGQPIRTLSFHETHEWHPSLLNDGRIVYTRWDYVDRNAAKFHGLWTCNQDGSNPSVLFGNYTTRPWACYQAKAIPGSNKVVFVAGGHHANVGGTLMLLDPARLALDPQRGEDRFEALTCVTPEVGFAEADGWPKSYYYSPWPLSEKHFLVAFSHDPLTGGYTGEYRNTETGIYYLDVFGNLELLYRQPGIASVYPMPLAPRTVPVAPAPQVAAQEKNAPADGEFLLSDVRCSLLPLPADRSVTQLRVFQVLPKSRTDNAGDPRIGHPDQANARMLLGTVPVEQDGSAYFRAPANKPLCFQAVDEEGRAVQGMRSIVYLQPGEKRGCVGCHEPPGMTPPARHVTAALRPPSVIEPGPDGSSPFGYARLIQPILNQYCVRCHDGSVGPEKDPLVLTGEVRSHFTRSYENLLPFLSWPSPDDVTRPGQLGADASRLSAVLAAHQEKSWTCLPDASRRAIYLWLDAHVPFYGTYEEEGLRAQRQGLAIAPPELQ
jgi:hypothetical protein